MARCTLSPSQSSRRTGKVDLQAWVPGVGGHHCTQWSKAPRSREAGGLLRSAPTTPLAIVCAACLGFFILPLPVSAAEPVKTEEASGPFYDQEPYDLVILNDTAKTKIKALPLT